jgi:hypothetical protein
MHYALGAASHAFMFSRGRNSTIPFAVAQPHALEQRLPVVEHLRRWWHRDVARVHSPDLISVAVSTSRMYELHTLSACQLISGSTGFQM